jgi:hypothetical protein
VDPLALNELAALLRGGGAPDGPIANYQQDCREAPEVCWKKDDWP